MKIKILFTLLFLATISFAQQKGLVYYGYIYSPAEGNAHGLDYNAYLVFNKNQSYYVTAKDSLEKAAEINKPKTYSNEENGNLTLYGGLAVNKTGDRVKYDIKKDTLWADFIAFDVQYRIKEVAPKMKWKIQNETKKIGNFICKKATTSFRGRDYTAWFAPDLILPFGPWKLHGLPGLILEAYDEGKFVYWYFKNVEYPTKSKENIQSIKAPKENPFVTYEGFKLLRIKAQEKEKEDIILMNQQFKDKGVTFQPVGISKMFVEFE